MALHGFTVYVFRAGRLDQTVNRTKRHTGANDRLPGHEVVVRVFLSCTR